MKPKLSISMIVKDEKINLRRCLDSFLPIIHRKWCELIIVDTGSKDNTVEIAKEYTKKVFFRQWDDDFSAARNFSLSKCKGKRILIVDADEELKQSSLYVLERDILNPNYKKKITLVTIKHFYNNLNNEYADNLQQRIFFNDGFFHYESIVHNKPVVIKPEYVVSPEIIFNHYGFKFLEGNGLLLKKKTNRSLPLLLKVFQKNPADFSNLTHLIKTYAVNKQWALVILFGKIWLKDFEKLKENIHEGWFSYTEIFVALVNAYIKKEQIESAERIKNIAFSYSKRIFPIYFSLGEYYTRNKQVEKAVDYFEHALELYNTPNDSIYEKLATNNVRMLIPTVLNYLATIYFIKKDFIKSGKYINAGVQLTEIGSTFPLRWDIFNEPEARKILP